jgi:Zn-dependent peptidase ImmA (M78 family)
VVRWRFDLAHELGHILLHAHVTERELARPQDFKLIESQAHRFAAAFLLPLESFAEDFFAASLDALRAIKNKWKVSIGMMIRRARQAELISEETERRLWIGYGRRKWRTREPLDDILEPEYPRIIGRALQLLLSSGGQSAEDVVGRLCLSRQDIETLAGVREGF